MASVNPTSPLPRNTTTVTRQRISAIKVTQNDHDFFICKIPTKILSICAYVSRRSQNKDKGFQRLLARQRARDISQYLAQKRNSIATSIVLSAQPDSGLEFDENSGSILFLDVDNAFLVLDGQHRLWGFSIALEEFHQDYEIPVVIYNHLTSQDEVKLFIDINTTQRGVPSALLLDIKQLAGTERKIEESLRLLFDYLNASATSPLAGLMSPDKSVVGKISRVVFNQSAKQFLESDFVRALNDENKQTLLENYFSACVFILREMGTPQLITRAIVFSSFMNIFQEVIKRSLEKHGNAKFESIKLTMSPIMANVEISEYSGSNKGTEQRLTTALKRSLEDDRFELTSDMI